MEQIKKFRTLIAVGLILLVIICVTLYILGLIRLSDIVSSTAYMGTIAYFLYKRYATEPEKILDDSLNNWKKPQSIKDLRNINPLMFVVFVSIIFYAGWGLVKILIGGVLLCIKYVMLGIEFLHDQGIELYEWARKIFT